MFLTVLHLKDVELVTVLIKGHLAGVAAFHESVARVCSAAVSKFAQETDAYVSSGEASHISIEFVFSPLLVEYSV